MTRPDAGDRLQLKVAGPFELSTVALLGFGNRDTDDFDGVLRLAFCVDGHYERQVGVAVRQAGRTVRLELAVPPGAVPLSGDETDRVRVQVARILSLDQDGAAFAALCESDPHLAAVYGRAAGFRPALFQSPYEAAVCSVVSARRSRRQGLAMLTRLAEHAGTTITVAGRPTATVPTPGQLQPVHELPGLPAQRLVQLHGIAEAAGRGDLDVRRLHDLPPAEALARLRTLPGIGPFYSSLILERACGHTDIAPDPREEHTRRAVISAYGLEDPDDDRLRQIVDSWRPVRTWVLTLLRSVADRNAVINR